MSLQRKNTPTRLLTVAENAEQALRLSDRVAVGIDSCVSHVAEGVAAALVALRNDPFDAVVARHDPATVDGLLLARALRGAGDETPVLLVVNSTDAGFADDAARAGCDLIASTSELHDGRLDDRLRSAIGSREAARDERRRLADAVFQLGDDERQASRLAAAQASLLDEVRAIAHDGAGDLDGDRVRRYVAASSEAAPAQRAA